MKPDKMAHLSSEEKKMLFMDVTIRHPQLEVVHDRIRRAIRQPAGFSFVLVHGPTGVGKTTMMETLIEQTKAWFLSAKPPAALPSFSPYGMAQALDSAEPGSMVQVGSGETPPAAPKRSRKKKTASETGAPAQTESTSTHAETSTVLQAGTDALAKASPAKPKRTRRVGEPKPIRYPVGELENEQGM